MQQQKSKKSFEDCLSSYGNSVGKPNFDVWQGNQKINRNRLTSGVSRKERNDSVE